MIPTGESYTGGWSNDKPNGFGIMVYLYTSTIMSNRAWSEYGAHYVGEWKNGKIHGQGTIYYKDGRISYKGRFDAGSCSIDCRSF